LLKLLRQRRCGTPIPEQQFVEAFGRVIRQPSEHGREPGLRVDVGAQLTFGGVVRQAEAPVIEEAGERIPTLAGLHSQNDSHSIRSRKCLD
jgi:hypothetical protein